jgi:tetratricopeptide (TPR) repeat protein
MKTLKIIPLLLAALILLASKLALAADKYAEAMQKQIQIVYSAKTAEEIQQAVNALERIGDAEKTRWEPFYYASFGYVMIAVRINDAAAKDNSLDLALKVLAKASALNQNESEVVALEGFIHMIRVTVDPASRGQQYSQLAFQSFGKALAINPENPRALALMAQMQYGTAQFFGSSTTEACQTLDKALEKFASVKSEDPIAPQWGREMAEGLKAQCR